MESEPEEGEIREGDKRSEDPLVEMHEEAELPRGYRPERVGGKRHSRPHDRPNSPKRSRHRSREPLGGRRAHAARSLSGTGRDDSASRSRGRDHDPHFERSFSGSRRSRSRSRDRGPSGPRFSRHISTNPSTGINVTVFPVNKKHRKRQVDYHPKNFVRGRPNSNGSNSRMTASEAFGNSNGLEEPLKEKGRGVHASNLSLTAVSPTPLSAPADLENVESVTDEEVAVVDVVHATDKRPELIVLDSTSSSEDESESTTEEGIEIEGEGVEGEEELDLEELELRKDALEGLVRKLDPSDPLAETSTESNCDILSSPLSPEPEPPQNTPIIEFTSDPVPPENPISISEKSAVSPTPPPPQDDSEKENDLELYLLRAKLLSDLAKKGKTVAPSNPASESGPMGPAVIPPANILTRDKIPVATTVTPVQQQYPSITRILPSSPPRNFIPRLDKGPIITGREHESPTSYSYAPMPASSRPPRPIPTVAVNPATTLPIIQQTFANLDEALLPPPHTRRVEIMDTTLAQVLAPKTVTKPVSTAKVNVVRPRHSLSSSSTSSKAPSTSKSVPQIPTGHSSTRKAAKADIRQAQAPSKSNGVVPLNGSNHLSLQQNDLFSIRRTVINPHAISNTKTRYHRSATRRNESSSRFPPPKTYKKIVIPLRDDDTSSDEDYRDESPEVEGKEPVHLPDAFHTKLDNFLKTVRESATRNAAAVMQASAPPPSLDPAFMPSNYVQKEVSNSELSTIASAEVLTLDTPPNINSGISSPNPISPLPSVASPIHIDQAVVSNHSPVIQTKEASPFSPPVMEPTINILNSPSSANSTLTVVTPVETEQPVKTKVVAVSPLNLMVNEAGPSSEITRRKVQSSVESVKPIPEVLKEDGCLKLQTPPLDKPPLNKPPSKSSVPVPKSSPDLPGPKTAVESGRKSPIVKTVTTVAQTRAELQLRERILRATLLKSVRKLKLTKTEKELVDTRKVTTEYMDKVLQKVTKCSEKEKQCADMEKHVQRIKRQLEMVEKNLASAKKETVALQDDFLKAADAAFTMRKKFVEIGKNCSTIGKQLVGDDYRIPSSGSAEMLTKLKEIRKYSTIYKKLRSSSSEVVGTDSQTASGNPNAGTNSEPNSAAGSSHRRTLVNREQGPRGNSTPDEEAWNSFKSQGLTKCLRSATMVKEPRQKAILSPVPLKAKAVIMEPRPISFGVYVPYSSPIIKPTVDIKIKIQNAMDPVCSDSITSVCKKINCQLQHLIHTTSSKSVL